MFSLLVSTTNPIVLLVRSDLKVFDLKGKINDVTGQLQQYLVYMFAIILFIFDPTFLMQTLSCDTQKYTININ